MHHFFRSICVERVCSTQLERSSTVSFSVHTVWESLRTTQVSRTSTSSFSFKLRGKSAYYTGFSYKHRFIFRSSCVASLRTTQVSRTSTSSFSFKLRGKSAYYTGFSYKHRFIFRSTCVVILCTTQVSRTSTSSFSVHPVWEVLRATHFDRHGTFISSFNVCSKHKYYTGCPKPHHFTSEQLVYEACVPHSFHVTEPCARAQPAQKKSNHTQTFPLKTSIFVQPVY